MLRPFGKWRWEESLGGVLVELMGRVVEVEVESEDISGEEDV